MNGKGILRTAWDAIVNGFSKSFVYSGRASRSDYNWFALYSSLILFVTADEWYYPIVSIVFLFPQTSLITRRLHDIGKSGWLQLISLTIIGILPLLYWLVFKKGDEGNNIYGQNPLNNDSSNSKNEKHNENDNKKEYSNKNRSKSSSKNDVRNIKTEKYYGELLGLKGKITMSDIHKAYKSKMKDYHPDKVETMADEFKELASEITKEINEAYEYFKKKYGA